MPLQLALQDFLPLALRLFVAAILGFFLYQVYLATTSIKGQLPLPPTVPGFPVIGSLIEIAKASIKGQQHLLITTWARQYGDIFSVKVGPFVEYFLNSDVAVKVNHCAGFISLRALNGSRNSSIDRPPKLPKDRDGS